MKEQERRSLISDMIEKSNYIHRNTKRGKASFVRIGDVFIEFIAKERGITFEEAVQHIDAYFKGEIGEL